MSAAARSPLAALWDADLPEKKLESELVARLLRLLTEHAERFLIDLRGTASADQDPTVSKRRFTRRMMRALTAEDARTGDHASLVQPALEKVFNMWDVNRAGELSLVELSRIMLRRGQLRKPRNLRYGAISQTEILKLPAVDDSLSERSFAGVPAIVLEHLAVALSAKADAVMALLQEWLRSNDALYGTTGSEVVSKRHLKQVAMLHLSRELLSGNRTGAAAPHPPPTTRSTDGETLSSPLTSSDPEARPRTLQGMTGRTRV
jgi:hypothetical protein